MPKYPQRRISVTDEQRKFIELNDGKMEIRQIAKMLGLSYHKVQHNRGVMGLIKCRGAKVIIMEGYFDVDSFQHKYYNF